jgi:predicted nucleic acid-binding Zn ribbon protein
VHTQAPPSPPATDPQQATCPGCGKPVDPSRPFCLECGRRIGHDYKRPPNWRIPLGLIAALVVAAGIAAGFGITALTGNDEGPKSITVQTGPNGVTEADPGEAPTAAAPTPAPAQPPPPPAPAPEPAPPAEEPQASGPETWPEGEEAFTVVLLTTKSKQTADETADKAIAAGLPAGVLESSDFKRFEPGLYVVFSGQFDNVDAASTKAQQVSDKNPGAYARFVEPK